MAKNTISYSDTLEEQIIALEDAGVIDGRSDFFQRSAAMYLMMLDLGVGAAYESLEDVETVEEMNERLQRVDAAISTLNY